MDKNQYTVLLIINKVLFLIVVMVPVIVMMGESQRSLVKWSGEVLDEDCSKQVDLPQCVIIIHD